jgi:hypothetical protein
MTILKTSFAIFATSILLIAGVGSANAQIWAPLANHPTFSAGNAYLLTDGRVMVQVTDARDWWILTPNNYGSYAGGTWSKAASLPSGYGPLYYAAAVLPDGRVVVIGGEYNLGFEDWTTLGAIYSPATNTWKTLSHPSGWTRVGDAQSVILANGSLMIANCCTTQQALLNASTLTWTATGTGKADSNNEEGWTLLPNGKVLTVDVNSGNTNSEIYNPANGSWSSAGSTIVKLPDAGSHELGPAVLRPNGTVLYTGATGHNSVYNALTSKWSSAPNFPKLSTGQQLDIADGPAALLPNGNVLCMTSPGVYQMGAHFFEWNGTSFKQVPGTPRSAKDTSYFGRMLVLPTGEILLTDGSTDVELYTSTGGPAAAWAPTITKVPSVLKHGTTVALSGTQLNGLSQGAAYGDDAQSASNYPLVRITNNVTGRVFYCRTHNHTSMGVATGSLIVTTHVDIPGGIELGAGKLEVVTNGIASRAVNVTVI